MKKAVVLCLVLALFAALNFGGQEEEKAYTHHTLSQDSRGVSMDIEAEKEQHRRWRQRERRMFEASEKARIAAFNEGISKPQNVDIQTVSGSTNNAVNYNGNYIFMAACTNAGTSSGVFVEATARFYDSSGTLLGSESTYVHGGTNTILDSTGTFTNALNPGDSGYFRMYTDIEAADVSYTTVTYSYSTYANTTARAKVDFSGTPTVSRNSWGDYTLVSGSVKNSSNAWLTYFTETYFCFRNSGGQVLYVGSAYVIGSNYNVNGVDTDTALYPGETGTFSSSFGADYDDYFDYLNSFEWYEAVNSNLPEQNPPFGTFDTPHDGSTVSSSIAVTGWVLDDSGVESVKVYRGQGNNPTYIGDAQFVEGARPDIAADYPGYPNNTSAGWGYMMLTNFLPNSGNGTFTLQAIATDGYGKKTVLGTRTITCDNAHAVKPFGAIDSPLQGGSASGTGYLNWGWALTPQPKKIPTNGSTIDVWLDSKYNLGHPSYNMYRQDIANLFPDLANKDGAVGLFELDTTAYADGVHTIHWTAADNEGSADGIGSRYFTIQNTSNRTASQSLGDRKATPMPVVSEITALPDVQPKPVRYTLGFNPDAESRVIPVDAAGVPHVSTKLFQRVVIGLEGVTAGYTVIGGSLHRLPIGSTLDTAEGAFYWMPMQAFKGPFRLMFVIKQPDGSKAKKEIVIDVE